MGEVYRARDPKLNRFIAIKVLLEATAANPERRARFAREAQSIAALSHPNIVTIHSVEEAEGLLFLTMEYVDGTPLSDLIGKGLPLTRIFALAIPLTDAISAAHQKGITHRDLKPANVMVTTDGRVKVLDFGLAKLMEAPASEIAVLGVPPDTLTEDGRIVGTVAYMSPEQAEGKPVDGRSDVFSLGVMLYEMATGERPFTGETRLSILSAIVKDTPHSVTDLNPAMPREVARVVKRCLAKERERRYQTAVDLRNELEELRSELESGAITPTLKWIAVEGEPAAPAATTRVRRRAQAAGLVVAMSLIVAALAALVAAMYLTIRRGPPTSGGVARLEIRMPPGVDFYGNAALSPDGTRVAYIGAAGTVRQVYVHELNELKSYPLPSTATDAHRCFFLFSGQALGFYSAAEGTLKQVALSGALGSILARDVAGSATWGRDGQITFVHRNGGLWQVPASGGTPRPLTRLEPRNGEVDHAWPAAIGTGQVILFEVENQRGESHIEAVSTTTGLRTILVEAGALPRYAPSGHLLFKQGTDLYAAPFDADRLKTTNPAVRVLQNVGDVVSVSSNGSLLYSEPILNRLVWVSREGKEEAFGEARSGYWLPALSPNGRHVALEMDDGVWDYDLDHDTFTPLSEGGSYPVWAPDSTRVVLRTASGMKWIDRSSGKPAQPIPGSSPGDYPGSVGPDGNTVVFTRMSAETKSDIYLGSLDGRIPRRPIVNGPAHEHGPQISPRDGRYLAYVTDQSGRSEVSVCLLPDCAHKWPVSRHGGTEPRWSRDGTELFYRSDDRMMSIKVLNNPDTGFSQPEVVFERHYSLGRTRPLYDVAPDGRFLMIRDEPDTGRLILVINWIEELKARMAASK